MMHYDEALTNDEALTYDEVSACEEMLAHDDRLHYVFRLGLFIALIAALGTSCGAQVNEVPPTLRTMSFNIRYGSARDGDNHWRLRKELVVETIANYRPDIVGTQETLDFQAEFLTANLPEYTYVGRGRDADGSGEQSGILFRKTRFDKLIEGHFWLSDDPDRPGSKSWDSSLPRMATWLKLWDRQAAHSFYILNTHFDHRGQQARAEGARIIRDFINGLPEDSQVIITGDFNAAVDSQPYRELFASGESTSPLVDTFAAVHPDAADNVGTFNGFQGRDGGSRIDWIGVTSGIQITDAAIDRSNANGRFPSDHYPVTAQLRIVPRQQDDRPNSSGNDR